MGLRGRSALSDATVMFVTTSLIDWEPLFSDDRIRDKMAALLFEVAAFQRVTVFGYCIMSTHIHLLVGHIEGGPAISRFMQALKSLSSRRLFPDRHGVWQRRFDDVVIPTQIVFNTKLRYIHENPVRAGIVKSPEAYTHSSARAWDIEGSDPRIRTHVEGWSDALA